MQLFKREVWLRFLGIEEMADGRHGVFDGQLLRWSDGSIWRRVDEQSGVHQATVSNEPTKLGGGFKDFLFSSLFGEMIQFD